jgi:HEAT repeat protein
MLGRRYPRITFEAALRDMASTRAKDRVFGAEQLGHPESLPGRVNADEPVTRDEQARATEALRRALGDTESEVRYAAAFSLAELGDIEAVPLLLERLGDGNARARQAAAIALGRLKDRRALERLREELRDGPPDLRYQAAMSLAEIAPDEVLDDLITAIADEDAEVREAVAAALGQVGQARAAGWLGGLLEDARPDTRFEAAFALARLGDRRAVPALLAFLTDKRRVMDVLEALLLVPDERARGPLEALERKWMTAPVVKVRIAAVLAALGDPRSRAWLCERLERGRMEIRGMAVHVLGEMAGPWARAALETFRASPASVPFREAVDEALMRAKGEPA